LHLPGRIDHLVYAVPDLEAGIAQVEQLLGVRAVAGGRHPGRGTRNALLALGDRTYLEIIGPDSDQPQVTNPMWLGVDRTGPSRLRTWAAASLQIEAEARAARAAGAALGDIVAGARTTTDGVELRWRFTDPSRVVADGVVPFLIDWGDTPHPAQRAPQGATLVALRAEHPQADGALALLGAMHLDLAVQAGPHPTLIATIEGKHGRVELR
jgi:hypothetical protein